MQISCRHGEPYSRVGAQQDNPIQLLQVQMLCTLHCRPTKVDQLFVDTTVVQCGIKPTFATTFLNVTARDFQVSFRLAVLATARGRIRASSYRFKARSSDLWKFLPSHVCKKKITQVFGVSTRHCLRSDGSLHHPTGLLRRWWFLMGLPNRQPSNLSRAAGTCQPVSIFLTKCSLAI